VAEGGWDEVMLHDEKTAASGCFVMADQAQDGHDEARTGIGVRVGANGCTEVVACVIWDRVFWVGFRNEEIEVPFRKGVGEWCWRTCADAQRHYWKALAHG